MGGYADIDGRRDWYEEVGAGEPLVLLHGALSTNETWSAQMEDFGARFHVIAPERRGHGHTPDLDGPLSYDAMAEDTIGFLDVVVGGPAHLVGWSDGGIVGLLVAMARPDLVRKLVVIGANFDTSGVVPEAMQVFTSMSADSDDLADYRRAYEAASPDGPEHWPVVVGKVQEMAASEPNITAEQLSGISAPTLVLVGDDDLVTLEHASALYRAIVNSQLAVAPGTSHFLHLERPALVNRLVLDFLEEGPVSTLMPIRRQSGASHER